jgi:hypothetical protein
MNIRIGMGFDVHELEKVVTFGWAASSYPPKKEPQDTQTRMC